MQQQQLEEDDDNSKVIPAGVYCIRENGKPKYSSYYKAGTTEEYVKLEFLPGAKFTFDTENHIIDVECVPVEYTVFMNGSKLKTMYYAESATADEIKSYVENLFSGTKITVDTEKHTINVEYVDSKYSGYIVFVDGKEEFTLYTQEGQLEEVWLEDMYPGAKITVDTENHTVNVEIVYVEYTICENDMQEKRKYPEFYTTVDIKAAILGGVFNNFISRRNYS